jgi:c-di-GMP-binding flagellar brake protein YcgR
MDYTNLYSTRIQKSFDEDQADILAVLKSELSKNPQLEVQLINYHKGLPVSFKAKVASVDRDAVDLDVTAQQAVAISKERYTFIRSNLFKNPILAKAQYVSVRHKAVFLRKLCFIEIMAERRNHIRLELEPPINAIFNSSSGIVRGQIVELSMSGVVMVVAEPLEAVIGEEVNLSMMLPDTVQNTVYNIKFPAKIYKVAQEAGSTRLIICITSVDRISDRVMAKYLFNRQIEIIHEIKDASELEAKLAV